MKDEDEKLGQAFAGVDSIQGYNFTSVGMIPTKGGDWVRRTDIVSNIRLVINLMKDFLSATKFESKYTGLKDTSGFKLNEGNMIRWYVAGKELNGTVFWDVHRDGWATTKHGLGIPQPFSIIVEQQHETD